MDKRGRLTPARAVNEVFGMSPTMDRAAFLPVGREPGGETEFAWPGLLYDAARAMVTPGVGMKGGKVTLDDVNRVAMEAGILGSVARRPANSLGMFGGVKAKTADLGALGRAHELLKQGADARKIWDETGWFQGADGKWRFEIDDSGARFDGSVPGGESRRVGDRPLVGAIGDVAVHPELMRAYPDVADVEFARVPMQKSQYGGYAGSSSRGKPLVAVAEGRGIPNERSAALHELQHDIQRREGFPGGGSASEFEAVAKAAEDALPHLSDLHSRSGFIDAFTEARREGKLKTPRDAKEFRDSYYASSSEELWDEYAKLVRPLQDAEDLGVNLKHWNKAGNAYKRLAGEVEARNVQTRRDFTPDQRRAQPPWETEDVPRDRQIVRFRGGIKNMIMEGR